MDCFDNSNINLEVLKKKAFNYRWAEVPDGVIPLTAAGSGLPHREGNQTVHAGLCKRWLFFLYAEVGTGRL